MMVFKQFVITLFSYSAIPRKSNSLESTNKILVDATAPSTGATYKECNNCVRDVSKVLLKLQWNL